jgi:hypothetical protein
MSYPGQILPAEPDAPAANSAASSGSAPDSWRELRDNPDIQFEEIPVAPPPPPPEPQEPGAFEEALQAFFEFLGSIFSPIGQLLGATWPILQWVLLALVAGFVLYLIVRTIGPLAGRNRKAKNAVAEPEWQPDREESVALLGDADQLAAEGRYDEATHLLLQRSVGQIANARPDWVEPSSTARELAALPALSDAARTAFATISERVERSLFALRSLDRNDWEAARSAYANFALANIDSGRSEAPRIEPRRRLAV